ncbi:MAG: aminotransferase class III-fold pyridoxal phosphate-dependent enzyme [Sphingomonadaceae bacterium]|nr:aminotransferase class III-fold pyridoxal phosphate-dependent enzyme [Sphingomonadaceae bacterium]
MVNAYDPAAGDLLASADRALIARRARALGPAYRLFYQRPLHLVRGEGVWLYSANGERYLDAYNNVAAVGHCHPRVVAAIAGQAATLATHTRYLDATIVAYAERLVATLPPPLAHVMFTCTGSEANDLALRMARARVGRGVIVTSNAYHGVTELLAGMSPSLGPDVPLHPFVRSVAPPGHDEPDAAVRFASRVAAAADELAAAGHGPAVLLLDTILSSDGVLGGPAGVIAPAVAATRAAGGLFIADEVQAGLGRVGPSFWGFCHHGVAPDLVTCGKPMGNGYPVAMVACRTDLAQAFGKVRYFNTFGGNAVAAAAGIAVLDVIDDERLASNAAAVGDDIRAALADLSDRTGAIANVRGTGLAIAADCPTPTAASTLVNRLRDRGVLISATGADGRTLKIRPPLPFAAEHADQLVSCLADVLR